MDWPPIDTYNLQFRTLSGYSGGIIFRSAVAVTKRNGRNFAHMNAGADFLFTRLMTYLLNLSV